MIPDLDQANQEGRASSSSFNFTEVGQKRIWRGAGWLLERSYRLLRHDLILPSKGKAVMEGSQTLLSLT
jgi:hypothetical protein